MKKNAPTPAKVTLDTDTIKILEQISQQYYHHLLGKRKEAGRFVTHMKETDEIPGWPYPATKEKKDEWKG